MSAMDDSDTELIRHLLTRAGCIMEDTSTVALSWHTGLSVEQRLDALQTATRNIAALVDAAKAVSSEPAP